MNSKAIVWIFMAVGSTIGGAIPMLWNASVFSMWSLILGSFGAMLGIYVGFKLTH